MSQLIALSNKQRDVVLWSALILGVLIIAAAILYAIVQSKGLPDPPTLAMQTGETPEIKAKQIQNYQELLKALQLRSSATYETVVIKTLLPLFTGIIASVLTYVFTTMVGVTLQSYFANKYKNS